VEALKAEFVALADEAKDKRLNALVVQVRPAADAFYESQLNPWSEYLTGTQGQSPGFDPLAFMIEEAHKRGLEFHAWFNPFRVSNTGGEKNWAENSMVRRYPSWVVDYDNKKYLNPGIPEARAFVLESIMEVVRGYDIDAVHFDDYFYPYPARGETFPDSETFVENRRVFDNIADWRRDNVSLFIKSVWEAVKAEKPYVQVGISPFAIWRSKANDPAGIETTSDVSSYDSNYADTLLWVRNNWVDYIAPQIYWEFDHKSAAYGKVLDFWIREMVKYPDVNLYVGHAAYKIGSAGSWHNPQELPDQLRYNQKFGAEVVRGSIFYNIAAITNNYLGFGDTLKNHLYKYPALPPVINSRQTGDRPSAVSGAAPGPVTIHSAEVTEAGVEITFGASDENTAYFVVYRGSGRAPDIEDPSGIIGVIRHDGQPVRFADGDLAIGARAYAITALDRFNKESLPSFTAVLSINP
jgi:uncharacterized lipoprotein YddW (UPF0748 family)